MPNVYSRTVKAALLVTQVQLVGVRVTQPGLFDVVKRPRANPVKAEIDRLNAAAERVLERLKQGPATNVELVAVGGIRAVGRVFELKRDGYHIEKEHVSGGTWRYRLVGLK